MIKIINGDASRQLSNVLGDQKFQCVLTDPPYGLGDGGFMNETWDKGSPVFFVEFWKSLSEVLHPGALVFCFTSSYRYHKCATAAESAGYQIYPMLGWVYATGMGFGKRHATYPTHIVGQQALKPALEPIMVAQRCTEGLTKSQCLDKFGTGGFHVDNGKERTGRLPSNIIVERGAFNKTTFQQVRRRLAGAFVPGVLYVPKPTTKERDAGLDENEFPLGNHGIYQARKQGRMAGGIRLKRNPHPTVKPIALAQALAEILLPPTDNKSILIPFAGVGSEVIGAAKAGFDHVVGVEIEPKYITIAEQRVLFHVR